jgi:hypothetical protein
MYKRIIALAACLAVTACGGGGSGGGSAPTATAELTVDNSVQIAGATADAALFSSEFDQLANLGLLGSPGGVAVAQAGGEASVTLARKTSQLQAISSTSTTLVSVSESDDCPLGGTMSISAEIQNPETLSAGDNFSLSYADCDFGDGVLANGSISFRVTSMQGELNGDNTQVGFDLQIANLEIAEVGDGATIDGDISMSLNLTPTATTVSMSGSSLSVTSGVDSMMLSDYSTTVTADLSAFPESVTLQSSGFLMNSEFDGEVQFSTDIALQVSGENNPTAGRLRITGANGGIITVIPLDSLNVRVELDLDGDNAVDEGGTLDMTWQELLEQEAV